LAIPSARVLTDAKPSIRVTDPEHGEKRFFPPRGGSNSGKAIAWWYWIPHGDGQWLQAHTEQMQFKGLRKALIVTDEQVEKKLASGDLFVSLQRVDQVKEIVKNSMTGSKYLQELLM
jgi:hypothetical protein